MHELGITQGIVDRARDAARAHGASRITGLYLVTTPAADFTDDAIRMYFAMLTADDPAFQDACLYFDRRAAEALCLDCGFAFSALTRRDGCPACSSLAVKYDPSSPMMQLTDIDIDDGQGK